MYLLENTITYVLYVQVLMMQFIYKGNAHNALKNQAKIDTNFHFLWNKPRRDLLSK